MNEPEAEPRALANLHAPIPASNKRTISNFRWYICGLLLYATTVNYMDRMVLSILEPTIARNLHWSSTDYGYIVGVFQAGYAIMMPIAGRLIDWLGLRIGYAASAILWAGSSMCHALARTAGQFALARLGLGLGEAANFPACIKAVADWFPRRERALATGIFNGGSNLGALVAPLLVPWIASTFTWRAAFLCTGSLSLSWVVLWLIFYREPEKHPRLSVQELELIRSDQEQPEAVSGVPYARIIRNRAAWAFIVGKFLTDPVWWFYLFWLPNFLHNQYGVNLSHLGAPLVAVYAGSAFGSIFGGWLSSSLLKRGWRVGAARKTAMLVCALSVVSVVYVPQASGSLWLTVGLISIATAAHQGWSANLFTITSDCFRRSAVASIVGLGGLAGAVGAVFAQPATGRWLDYSHNHYAPLFYIAGSMYLFTLLIIQLLLPRFEQQKI
jgi:ACS family hexuronate transporter-like MFS transporter